MTAIIVMGKLEVLPSILSWSKLGYFYQGTQEAGNVVPVQQSGHWYIVFRIVCRVLAMTYTPSHIQQFGLWLSAGSSAPNQIPPAKSQTSMYVHVVDDVQCGYTSDDTATHCGRPT
jgi:hypothetical protein